MDNETDWSSVKKALLGVHWLKVTNDVDNKDRSVSELYLEHCNFWEGERLLNTGVLMMASYMFFVYPQQKEFDEIDYSYIDISDF